uniref:NADH dehydrogenase subunit 2 n=1 Tax=Caulacanthus okamurae TaxID=152008 RepID=A0A6H1U9Q2_9FLOR|nr:NADH dehydrogenase subunit 2 [Caulacanthus okamurae]QIZ74783.1 NADH dehydrogenase subunit 2 [Caulacanthus okamurae]
MNNFLYNVYPLLPEIFLTLTSCVLLFYGVIYSVSKGAPLLTKSCSLLTFQGSVLSLILLFSQELFYGLIWNEFLVVDFFTYEIKAFVIFSFSLWLLISTSYASYEKVNSFEYWVLILLALIAVLLIVQAYDFLIVYLCIEFQSLIFYILASLKRTSEFSTEAGLKYFVLGAFSSAVLLFGISLVYGLTGLTNLNDFSKFFTNVFLIDNHLLVGTMLGLILIIVALLFKLGVAPFHMWVPDVYEGSPTSVTAFFSIIPKLAVLSLICRLLVFSFYDFIDLWYGLILSCAFISILVGSLNAFTQKKWKRFFAFSSINNAGFFLLALLQGNGESLSNLFFYVIIYMVSMIGVFAILMSLRFFINNNHYQSRYLSDLSGMLRLNPAISIAFLFILFSMAGIPPLAGFFSKIFILLPVLQNGAFGVSIAIIILSCISCFYYIRLIKMMYFDEPNAWTYLYPMDKPNSVILGLVILFIVFLSYDIEVVFLVSKLCSLAFSN